MLSIPAAVSVATTGQTRLVGVPDGPCQVVLQNDDSANFVTIGDANVAAGHGFILGAGKVLSFTTYPGSRGMILYAVASTAAVSVSILVSTPQ